MKTIIPPEHRPWCEPLPRMGDAADMCPLCDGKSGVTKKTYTRGGVVTRFRQCAECGHNYRTVELLAFGDQVSLRDRARNRKGDNG